MSIATRRGDEGMTGLLYGQRVPKDHPQIEAVGAFDELNVALGCIRPLLAPTGRDAEIHALLLGAQKKLVALMGEVTCAESDVSRYLASKFEKLQAGDVAVMDEEVRRLEGRGLRFDGWATPGGNTRAAAFDLARTVARRAERRLSGLPAHGRTVRPEVRQYINRLSDVLWLLAREAEQ